MILVTVCVDLNVSDIVSPLKMLLIKNGLFGIEIAIVIETIVIAVVFDFDPDPDFDGFSRCARI